MSIEVEVELEDLGTDASLWRESSTKLTDLAREAAERDLPDSAFMMAGYSFAQIYRRYIATVSSLLDEGATESDKVAKLLRSSSNSYSEANSAVMDEVRKLLAELNAH